MQLSHVFVFASLTSVFSSIPIKEGIVETNKEEQSIDDGGWQPNPGLSCMNRDGERPSHHPND